VARLKGEGRWDALRRTTAANDAVDRLLDQVTVVEAAPDGARARKGDKEAP
jgi:hypothetical protein